MPTALERFEEKYEPDPMTGCWLWTAGIYPRGGYGQFWDTERMKPVRAHRASWEFYIGPIPEGLEVLHTCDVRLCVNPRDLYLGTNEDNVRDRLERTIPRSYNGRKTHCKRGHPYDEVNTRVRVTKRGKLRECRTCLGQNPTLKRVDKAIERMF